MGFKSAIMPCVLCASNPSIWEMEARRLGFKSALAADRIQGQPGLPEILVWGVATKDSIFMCPHPGHPSYQYVLLSMSVTTVIIGGCWCSTLKKKKKKLD